MSVARACVRACVVDLCCGSDGAVSLCTARDAPGDLDGGYMRLILVLHVVQVRCSE